MATHPKLSIEDLVLFNRQLAAMVDSELPLATSIREIAKEAGKPKFQALIEQVGTEVENGVGLSEALSRHPAAFPKTYVEMVRIGEESGDLSTVLEQLAHYSEARLRLKAEIQGALVYPIIVMVAALIVVGIITFRVSPEAAAFGEALGTDYVDARTTVATVLLWSAEIVTLGLLALFFIPFTSIQGAEALGRKLPGLGAVLRGYAAASIARLLSMLLRRELPLPEALKLVALSTGDAEVRQAAESAAKATESGGKLSDAVQGFPVFTPVERWVIGMAENRETLPAELDRLAERCEVTSESAARRVALGLEIWVIVLVGVVVTCTGGLLIATIRAFLMGLGQ